MTYFYVFTFLEILTIFTHVLPLRNSVANMRHLDRDVFATVRKEMVYDEKIYLIFYK
jgi:hypothetical protein